MKYNKKNLLYYRLNRYQFPVKVTEPLTAILYITEDKQHIMELHKALHVKEVIEGMPRLNILIYTITNKKLLM